MMRREMLAGMSAAAFMGMHNAQAAEESTQRPMRRKDRELTKDEAVEIIKHTPHATLATCDKSGTPYITPISPVLDGNYVYFHTSASEKGRRYQNLMQNPKVSICWVGRGETASDELPGEFSVNYASAIASGKATLVKDEEEKKRLAMAIAMRQVPEAGKEGIEKYYAAGNKGIVVWKVELDSITGKARNKQGYFNKLKTQ